MKWLCLSIISFLLSSMTIWFMPYASASEDNTALYALAGLFWLGFILGLVFLLPISKRRKADRKYREKKALPPPLFRFFSNKPATLFDVLLIVGVVVLCLTFIIRAMPEWVTLTATFTAVFSVEMHGVFNGRGYAWLVNRKGKYYA